MCASAMGALSLYVYMQYKDVEQRAKTLLELQESCQQQIAALKLNQLQTQSVEEQSDPQKETLISQAISSSSQDSFTVVNRDKSYLKENLKTFVVAQKLLENGQPLAELYSADEYDFVDGEHRKPVSKSKKVIRKKRNVRPKKRAPQNTHATIQNLRRSMQHTSAQLAHRDFSFMWPIDLHNFWISSLFGPRKRADGRPGFHYGIDMAAMRGTPVKATAPGKVLQAQYVPGYGNTILIVHNEHYRSRCAHLDRILVKTGDVVHAGNVIGTVGATGFIRKSGRDGSHLHFEIHENGVQKNPLRYLFH